MLKNVKSVLFVFVLMMVFVSASYAQQPEPGTTKPPGGFVSQSAFKSKVFEVRHQDARRLATVVRDLGSGFEGTALSASSEFRTITVRDFPENLAIIEQALRRLDTPASSRPNIELHMYVLVASNNPGSRDTADVPVELKEVLTQLRETLSYRNYELTASVIQRLTETSRGLNGSGTTQASSASDTTPGIPMPYEYVINSVSLVENETGASTIQIDEFTFVTNTDKDRARVQTALNLRDGEKVVVGTATLRNRALVIVLSAKLVN